MKKLFTFMSALVVALAMNATTVTFDFTDAANFAAWGITEPSTASGFDLDGMSITKNGVTLSFAKNSNNTSPRIFNNNGAFTLRLYRDNTLTISVSGSDVINEIDLGQSVVTLVGGDESAIHNFTPGVKNADFTADATTRISSITVTINEIVPVWVPDTLSVSEARVLIDNNDPLRHRGHYIKGIVYQIDDQYIDLYQNVNCWMTDIINVTDTLEGYTMYGANNAKYTDATDLEYSVGDTVLFYATDLQKYTTIYEINRGYFAELLGSGPNHGIGSTIDTLTVAEAMALGASLPDNSESRKVCVVGYAVKLHSEGYNQEYGYQTLYLSDDYTATNGDFQVYKCNVAAPGVAQGNKIAVTGKILKYVGTSGVATIEIKSGNIEVLSHPYILRTLTTGNGTTQGDNVFNNVDTTVISATPNTGYHFSQWSDGNTDNPRTVVVTSDTTFTAEFAKNQYAISTSVQSGNGTTYGDSIAEYQDQIQISAVADYGWQFSRWNDGNGSNPRTVIATEDKEFKAIFVRKNFYVSVLSANTTMGYTYGSGNYEYESNATISATGRLGYEFNEWSDGNAENPRTFVVTGDTTFTATFRKQTQGECGNDLRWEYRNNVLYISGTGAMANYSTSTQPWYLYRDSIQTLVLNAGITSIGNYAFYGLSKITKLTLPEGLTTIGAYAFSGCNHITEIIFSSTISSIGDYAFYNCTRVLDMTNYATVTPDVATNALTSISSYAYLYVQAGYKRVYQIDNNWSRFDLREIGAETVTTPVEDVVVEPSENEAEFTWPTSTEAASYSLTITKDGIVFCTLTFNANGQLTGLAFAPDRNGAEHAAAATTSVAGMTFTVTGLDAATAYAFSFDAKDASQQVIESYTGTFATAGYQAPETPTEVEHVDGVNKYVNTVTKVVREGQVLILRGEKMYDLRGQEVK